MVNPKTRRAADLRPGMAARSDATSGYGLVIDASPLEEGSTVWRVQLAFFVDQGDEFDAVAPAQETDQWF